MLYLTTYSSCKILAQQPDLPEPIDFIKEAAMNPAPLKWGWCIKSGPGNEISTIKGQVIARHLNGDPFHSIRFDNRTKRNEAVYYLQNRYRNRRFMICVEFD